MLRPNIHLSGIQGSGKGTQARLLTDRFALTVLPTGELFRAESQSGSKLGNGIRERLDAGELMSDEELLAVVTTYLNVTNIGVGLLGDGSIRTVTQARSLAPLWGLHQLDDPILISFALTPDAARERIASRRASRVQVRADDTEEAIERRLALFEEHDAPLRDFFASQNRLHVVDATQTVEQITESVCAMIIRYYPDLNGTY